MKFLKTRRVFKALEWNRDSKLQYKAAHDIIACKSQAQAKFKFFFQWRTKFMQIKLLETHLLNKEATLKQKAFMAFVKAYDNKLKVRQCQLDRKLKLI